MKALQLPEVITEFRSTRESHVFPRGEETHADGSEAAKLSQVLRCDSDEFFNVFNCNLKILIGIAFIVFGIEIPHDLNFEVTDAPECSVRAHQHFPIRRTKKTNAIKVKIDDESVFRIEEIPCL